MLRIMDYVYNRHNKAMLSYLNGFYTIDEGMYQFHFFTAYEALLHLMGQNKNSKSILN